MDLPPMNENKKLRVEQYLKQEEVFYSYLEKKAKEDLFIFDKYILGVEDGKQKLVQFHKDLCHFVTDDQKKKKLILIPRGHLKSTLITIGYSLFRIINNPNIRILILNATWQMAVDFLSEIKRHLTSNETLIRLYGELATNPEEWSQDRVTLKRDKNVKGPTLWATGVDSNLVGSHPDMIILDDVVNRDNVTTQEQREKVILRYKDALDLLEPGGQLIVIGTRWNEDDLYSWIMDKENGIVQSYDVMIKKAFEGNIETGEGFLPLWESKFNLKELQDRLREKGWYEFSAQYMNNPIPDENATFHVRDFQHYNYQDIRGKEMTKILTVDPAISLKKEGDMTAMVASGLDQWSNLFILDIARGHFTPSEIIDKIFSLNEIWHFNQIGIETITFQKALAYSFKEEMQKRNRYLPITEIKSHEMSKVDRIKGLQPMYVNKKVWHRDKIELPLITYLEDELRSFPKGRRDDLIDALSMQLPLLYPPRQKVTRYHHKYLY